MPGLPGDILADELESALIRLKRLGFASHPASGLRRAEFFALRLIARLEAEGPVSPSDIAKHLGVTMGAITHQLNPLEEAGYIVRSSSDQDRRVSCLALSESGRKILAVTDEEHRQRLRGLLEYLGESDSRALLGLLDKIADYLHSAAGEQ